MTSDAALRERLVRLTRRVGAGRLDPTPPWSALERSVDPPADLVVESGAAGEFAARKHLLPRDESHGEWRLEEVGAVCGTTLALVGDMEAPIDPLRAVYLDIETTGLGGGAGNHCYLVGLGSFVEGGFELWQGFLRGPEDAPALMAECARRIGTADAVVSFFGKSFDRHRLEDAMRMHGIEAPFAGRAHLDLYYACRRLYGPAFPDGRLATMERGLCGVERGSDLPGALAPAAWFDWLAGRAHQLEGVFRHNALDVLSLVALCGHVGRASAEARADGRALGGPEAQRAEGLAKLWLARRERAEGLQWLERALGRCCVERRGALTFEKAEALRLSGEREAALGLFRELTDQGTHGAEIACASHVALVRLLLRVGAAEEAAGHLEQARKIAGAALVGAEHARAVRAITALESRVRASGSRV